MVTVEKQSGIELVTVQTDNNGNFSKDDNNIYHSRITEIKRTSNMFDFIDSLPTSIRAKTSQMLYSADLKMSCR